MKKGYDQHFDKLKKTKQTPSSVKRTSTKTETSAEQYLREALHMRAKVQKPKAKTPWTAFSVLLACACIAALGYFYPSKFEEVLSQFEISAFSAATAAEEGAKNSQTNAEGAATSAETPGAPAKGVCPEPKGFTEEELSHFNKLNERKKELDLREAELSSLEEELHKQKSEIETRIAKLEQIRADVANVLKERVEVDEQRVATLVDFYSNMKPKQAADIISTLNEDLAVEVLGKMKKKNAADILNLLEPNKARAISEKFTGYKRR